MEKENKKINVGEYILIDENNKERRWKFELPKLDSLPPDVYSNHVVINHNPNEFNFLFMRVNPLITENQYPVGEKMEIPVVAKIVMHPSAVRGFLDAFNKNWEIFEKSYKKKGKG